MIRKNKLVINNLNGGKMKKLNTLSLGVVTLLMPITAFAAAVDIDPATGAAYTFKTGSIEAIVNQIKLIVLGIATTIAIIAFVYGGIMYMLSGGDASKATKAKGIITNALIGIFVIIGMWFLVSAIIWALGKLNSGAI
jgi:hypothetical protein